jgi:hypothetical protein
MSYTPNLGFEPRTFQQIINQYLEKFNELTNQNLSLNEFLGSQNFQVSNLFAEDINQVELGIANIINQIFGFFGETQNQINTGVGSSYLGFINTFKDVCLGLNLVVPEAGKIAIYFDTPQDEDQQSFFQLFENCLGAGIIADTGDIAGFFVDALGVNRAVSYSKITSADYTKLYVKIKYRLKTNGLPIKEIDLKNLFEERFNSLNKIGESFYPETYISSQDFPSVADFIVESTLDPSGTFESIDRDPNVGGKFIIEQILVELL